MRIVPLVVAIALSSATALATEIREFDVKTIQKLGNELVRVSQLPDRGATTPVRKRARQTAISALQDKLYDDLRYEYVVLDDPAGSGFLVYALGIAKKKGDITTGGHYRVSTSADGTVAKRTDLLSQLIDQSTPDPGHQLAFISASQMAGKLPVETWVYSSYVYHIPIFVALGADGSVWGIANGRIVRVDEKGPKNHLDILNKKAPEAPQ